MSFGGEGILDIQPVIETAQLPDDGRPFIPRRFKTGGNLQILDATEIQGTLTKTCVLCGGLITTERSNLEHPLPQWLHKLAGDVGERPAFAFTTNIAGRPTWRQLCLASHEYCNTQFAAKIENPTKSTVKQVVDGCRVTWRQLDQLFDWLDKINASSAHMAVALQGHNIRLNYHELSFPNKRVGAFDRLAMFFRVRDTYQSLNLWDCLNAGFLHTPSALCLRIKDLIIVYASSNYLLTSAFGLGIGQMIGGNLAYTQGSGRFAPGFGDRTSRLPFAKIFAQPMRRLHKKEGLIDTNQSLQLNGDGKIYELIGTRWNRVTSTSFSEMVYTFNEFGHHIASLEALEWLIIAKEKDIARYQSAGFDPARVDTIRKSLYYSLMDKVYTLKAIAGAQGGLSISADDRK